MVRKLYACLDNTRWTLFSHMYLEIDAFTQIRNKNKFETWLSNTQSLNLRVSSHMASLDAFTCGLALPVPGVLCTPASTFPSTGPRGNVECS
jgi:hypothetical protein